MSATTPEPPAPPEAQRLLELLESRRSVRRFEPRLVEPDRVERLLRAATSAPSATNRQPWRFTVVRGQDMCRRIANAVEQRVGELYEIVRRGHHAEDLGDYGHYFHRPLQTAPLVIVPQYREHPDLMARFLASGGATSAELDAARQGSLGCAATSAAVMALLLQAHAEGLGACWMSGPLVARAALCELLAIAPPWELLGLVAVGYPVEQPPSPGRKPLSAVVELVDDAPTAPTQETDREPPL